jgi:sugar phosphate isomerase/epimerase
MAVRVGAFSDDLSSEFLPACALAANCGLDGLAVRNVGGRNVVEADDGEVADIKKQADDHGLMIASVGSQFGRGFYVDDDAGAAAAMDTLRRALDIAHLLGSGLVRIFALWLPGQEELPEWARRPDPARYLDPVAARLRPAARLAEDAGVTLMIELEGASYAGTVAEADALIKAIGSPAVALCWDVCNGWWSGEDPLRTGYPIALGMPIVDVQTKDVPARADDPARPTFGRAVVGQGGVPYREIIPGLIAAGYDGYFTAERVHHPRKPEQETELQRATLADIAALQAIVSGAASNGGDIR